MTEVLRNLGALLGLLGVAALLLPPPASLTDRRAELLRLAGLVAIGLGAVVLLASLVPGEDLRSAITGLASPARAGAAAVGLLVAIGLLVVAVRVVIARPTVWFVLLGIALPIRLPISVGSQEANLLIPLYLVIALGAAAWLWGRVRGAIARPAPIGPHILNIPLVAFVTFLLASMVWTVDPDEASIKAACFYLPFTVLYALILAWWPRGRALMALAVTTIAGGVVGAVMALWQYQVGEIWWNASLQTANVYSQFFRVNGFFFDPNILGRYLALGILVCLALAWVRRATGELVLLALAAAVMGAGLFVTYSRSSALMLMLGIAMLAVRAIGLRRALVISAVLVVVGGGLALATSSHVRHAATSTERLERVSEGRFDLMRGGLSIWADHPVAGSGLGGFASEFEQTLTPAERRKIRVVISHNTPVTVLSEVGLIGFGLFLALMGGAGWAAVRGSREQGTAGWARWMIGAALAGIVVHSLLYAALFEDPYVWALTAAAVALAACAAGRSDAAESDAPRASDPRPPNHHSEPAPA